MSAAASTGSRSAINFASTCRRCGETRRSRSLGALERSRGRGEGRAEPVRIRARFADRQVCVQRRDSPLGDTPSAEGDMTASVRFDRRLDGLPQRRAAAVPRSDDLAITAKVKAAPNALTLGDATLTSAGQTFEGALEIADPGGRPTVSGTLAAEAVALAPLLGPPERLFDPAGGWSAKPFALAAPPRLRPRLAPLGGPPRRLRPSALQRRRVGHRQWRPLERESHRGRRV